MPQTHNKKLTMDMDSSAFNKSSPFLAAYSFTEQSKHRVRVKNGLDKRLCRIKLKFYENESKISERKIDRVKARLVDNLQKRLAYKLVLRKHPIARAPDYYKALDGNYSYGALYHEVKATAHYMKPELVRERQAKALVDVNRKRYESLLSKNRAALDVLCPPPKRWQAVDFSKFGKKDGEDEEEEKTPSPELPAIEKRNRMSLAGLRRRVIAIDDSKPNSAAPSPVRSPTKAPPLSKPPSTNSVIGGKRQGITMSMMKKQSSFLSNREKTETIDTNANAKPSTEAEPSLDTNRSVIADRNAVDLNNNDVSGSAKNSPRKSNKTPLPDRTGEKLNKQSVLPPINSKNQQNMGIGSNDVIKSPTLGTGTPVKLPVLKMSTNNAGKEIKVH